MGVSNQIKLRNHFKKNRHTFLDEYMHMNDLQHKLGKHTYLFGLLGPIITIPQVIHIWVRRSAEDISMVTWLGYLLLGVVWLIYGIVYKEKNIILTSVLWMIMYLLIVAGKVLFG